MNGRRAVAGEDFGDNFVKSAIAASTFINRRALAASDKVNLAVIGVRSRGKSRATGFTALHLPDEDDERTLRCAL